MPLRELGYLQAVHRFLTSYIDKEKELQEIVDLAAQLCHASTSIICLQDEHWYHFKFKKGIETEAILKQDSFCQYLPDDSDEVLTISDSERDSRFTAMASRQPSLIFGFTPVWR